MPPLVLTVRLDAGSQARFQRLRDLHFPPERNVVPAHVTLFHHLPGEELDAIRAGLAEACPPQAPFPMDVSSLRSLGRGVAYVLHSPALGTLRAGLASRWQGWMTAQDRQPYRPHLTVQNKATPEVARALLAEMQAGFAPFTVEATGLLMWHYLGGPWELAGEHPFG